MKFFWGYLILFFQLSLYSSAQVLKVENLYKNVSKSVVIIKTTDNAGNALSLGSGVVVNNNGWIISNYHIIEGAKNIFVSKKNTKDEIAEVIGLNVEKDIVILRINKSQYTPIRIIEKYDIGEKVYAVGNPLGLENTISEGIISGIRNFENSSDEYIQITAPISNGSSGGAVVNSMGELIGISTWTFTKGQNLNFAIPASEILKEYKYTSIKDNALIAAYYLNKGIKAYEFKQYDTSILYLKLCIKNYPYYEDAYYHLGNCYSSKAFYGDKDYRLAIFTYEEGIKIAPQCARLFDALAFLLDRVGRYQEAVAALQNALKIQPKSTISMYQIGSIYKKMGNIDSSNYYRRKLEILSPAYKKIKNW